jgi:phosphoglycolate phosphatase-like HAD superfamily hydrolase
VNRVEALLWDVDGVVAETERDGHRVAFNLAFEAGGLPWRWDEARYGELLRVSGGRERLLADMATRADAPPLARDREALARALHASKNAFYARRVGSGAIALRDGVLELMQECLSRGVRMGIASTTSRVNVEALLRHHLGAAWQGWFARSSAARTSSERSPTPRSTCGR